MIRVIQIGDLHLDAASVRLAPMRAAAQRKISRGLMAEAVAYANAHSADLFVCTGDLFDTLTPYRDTVDAVSDALAALRCPAVLIAGNHDFLCERSPYRALRRNDNVFLCGSGQPDVLDFPFATVTGLSMGAPQPGGHPLRQLRRPQDGKPALAVLHGEPFVQESDYGAIPADEIEAAGFDLLMLGHIHIPRWDTVGKTLVTQNGSTEGHGYDEAGERGFLEITLDGGQQSCRLIPSSGSRAWRCEADVTGRAPEELAAYLKKSCPWEPGRTMLRLTLTGCGTAAGLEALAGEFLDFKRIDHTRSAVGPADTPASSTLRGMVEAALRAEAEQAKDDPVRARAALAMEFARAALENREQPQMGRR